MYERKPNKRGEAGGIFFAYHGVWKKGTQECSDVEKNLGAFTKGVSHTCSFAGTLRVHDTDGRDICTIY